jgi:hypothetical protein
VREDSFAKDKDKQRHEKKHDIFVKASTHLRMHYHLSWIKVHHLQSLQHCRSPLTPGLRAESTRGRESEVDIP